MGGSKVSISFAVFHTFKKYLFNTNVSIAGLVFSEVSLEIVSDLLWTHANPPTQKHIEQTKSELKLIVRAGFL